MGDSISSDALEGIAIIGMSGRFPGAKNMAEFWRNLRDGVESISFFTDEELRAEGIDEATLQNPAYVKAAGALEDTELFDASFFGFNPREAEIMDPQQRLFLECAWEAFEDAAYVPAKYQGSVGVYAGAGLNSYLSNIYANPEIVDLVGAYQIVLGNDKDHLTTLVSYKLNLKGPSIAVQTACSSSLVAVCLACQSLLNYQCDMALAGGVAVGVTQKLGYYYREGAISSPDGHCRAFDAKAQGTVGGNGLAAVVLKRLQDAIADGDSILAVIKGTAINNDGAVKVGYTAPSLEGQAEVIAMAQAVAGIAPETISYVEAHGTGTPLGDPIEVAALTEAFRHSTDRKGFCALGSVKTNIGHLDPAAGIAGLAKTVLALKHQQLPPSLHFQAPNPQIDLANSPFYVNSVLADWPAGSHPRRAGVSSFGIGGTNAHVVLEEAPPVPAIAPRRSVYPLVLSARTRPALEAATSNLAAHLRQHPGLNLADVAYTCAIGRTAFSHRRTLVCQSLADAASALGTLDGKRVLTVATEVPDRSVVFMFSGQGAQYVNMGLELYRGEPGFRDQVDLCSDLLKPHLGFDLRTILYPAPEDAEAAASQLRQTYITQPALFVIEYALAQLWMAWGVRPQAMIGHSIGEYVAACLAGVFSLEDALACVAMRGRLMQEMPAGKMLSVPLAEHVVRTFLNGHLSLAAVNAPGHCVVSGAADPLNELAHQLAQRGVKSLELHTSHAFHSAMMEPVLEPFVEQVGRLRLQPPVIRFVSNLTGTWITEANATDPQYWARQLRETVRFYDGLQELLRDPTCALLEVGPGRTLSTFVKLHPDKTADQEVLPSLRHPDDQQSDTSSLLKTLTRLWMAGVPVEWNGFYAHERRQRVSLPTYPFERKRYWIDPPALTEPEASQRQYTFRKKAQIADWIYLPSWQRTMPLESLVGEKMLAGQRLSWLLFIDQRGLGSRLAAHLEQLGQDVTTVVVGERFKPRGSHAFAINPQQRDDYGALLKELRAQERVPQMIVHLWNVTAVDETPSPAESFAAAQDLGFYSLLYLAQALGSEFISERLRISVVSNQMQAVTGDEVLRPEKATLLGPCKVIPQEYPNLTCRSIDVVMPEPAAQSAVEKLAAQLIAECFSESSDTVVAYRGQYRWTQTVDLAPRNSAAPPLRKGGVYLITGGMGDIGLLLAEHLARTVEARLILVGRSAFPAKEEWPQWLERDEPDDTGDKIRRLNAIEEMGAEVMVFSADVACRDEILDVVERAEAHFGGINGVIHAAGIVAADSMLDILEMDDATCERHFQPKAYGLYALAEAVQGQQLDFCLLFSSLSAVLGGLGFVAYSAANLFMDAFAQQRHQMKLGPWISVNWDAWQFSERPGDGAAGGGLTEFSILPEEGLEAFNRVLTLAPQAIVSSGDLQHRLDQWIRLTSLREAAQEVTDLSALHTVARHARPELPNAYVAPQDEVEKTIAGFMERLLGIKEVGIHDNFFEMGGHSLLAIQLTSRLRDAFRAEFSVQAIFNAPTVAELAENLRSTSDASNSVDKVTEMLQFVEQLSDAQLKSLLDEGKSP
jgi:acyl transferase domain-containing protein/acyl carrier protein